jgi:AraC-like DNA-binding protein
MKNTSHQGEPAYIGSRIAAPAAFEDVFTHFYEARNLTNEAVHKTLLPSYQTILIFSFGETVRFTSPKGSMLDLDKVVVLGPIKQPIDYTLPPEVDMLVVNFKSDGFFRFFGRALASTQISVDPDTIINDNCFNNLWSILKSKHTADRIQVLLEFAQPYLKDKDETLEQLDRYTQDSNVNAIKVVAQDTQQSERNIQLKYKKHLGYSAKEMARYKRFLNTIEYLGRSVTETSKPVDWQDVVTQFGYYDQSQLIHDFKHYLNLSPTRFLKFQQDICIARPE